MSYSDNFTWDYYKKLLDYVRENYTPRHLSSYPRLRGMIGNDIIIRHDVDLDFNTACHLAEIEGIRGVRATYMFMVDHQFYDISKNKRKLFRIQNHEHEIGLHYCYNFDPTVIPPDMATLRNSINAQVERLEDIIEEKVRSISFHRGSGFFFSDFLKIGDMVNGSSRQTRIGYTSDSMGVWREGEPIKWLEEHKMINPVYILTHPVWWGVVHQSPKEQLKDFIKMYQEERRMEIEKQIFNISDIKVWL